MHPQSHDSKGPHPLLWAGLQAACGKISGTRNCVSYFEIFITNLQAWPWPAGWRPVIDILQIKQIKASLHLWK